MTNSIYETNKKLIPKIEKILKNNKDKLKEKIMEKEDIIEVEEIIYPNSIDNAKDGFNQKNHSYNDRFIFKTDVPIKIKIKVEKKKEKLFGKTEETTTVKKENIRTFYIDTEVDKKTLEIIGVSFNVRGDYNTILNNGKTILKEFLEIEIASQIKNIDLKK